MKVFSVERIAGRLDDLFRLLTGGSRTALPRQQTLRALIDWSYNLLTEQERNTVPPASVFPEAAPLRQSKEFAPTRTSPRTASPTY